MKITLKLLILTGLLMSHTMIQAAQNWDQIYKDKTLTLLIDRGIIFENKSQTMLVWAKNLTSKKIVYTQYQIACVPQPKFKILVVNAKDKKTGKDSQMLLGDQPMDMHKAPKNSPAEKVVNAVCGGAVVKK
ncbi:MAG: hypothetical protein QM666_10560 [Acinetobacter sp.]